MKPVFRGAATFAAGLICGVLIFFPWDGAASAVASKALDAASEKNIFMTIGSSEASGIFKKNFVYEKVAADAPIARFSADRVTITPSVLTSLLTPTKKVGVTIGRGSIVPVTRQTIEWSGGKADVSVTPDAIKFDDVNFTGKSSLTGYAEISRSTGRVEKARLLLKVPPELDRAVQTASRMGVPLSKVKDGEWRIEK